MPWDWDVPLKMFAANLPVTRPSAAVSLPGVTDMAVSQPPRHGSVADLGSLEVHHAREGPLEAAGPSTGTAPGLAGPLQQDALPPSGPASLKAASATSALSPRSSRGLPDIGSPLNPGSPKGSKPYTAGKRDFIVLSCCLRRVQSYNRKQSELQILQPNFTVS